MIAALERYAIQGGRKGGTTAWPGSRRSSPTRRRSSRNRGSF